jgi:hypothetical protein
LVEKLGIFLLWLCDFLEKTLGENRDLSYFLQELTLFDICTKRVHFSAFTKFDQLASLSYQCKSAKMMIKISFGKLVEKTK